MCFQIQLPSVSKSIWNVLVVRAHPQTHIARISFATLMADTSSSLSSVQRGVKELEHRGLLTCERAAGRAHRSLFAINLDEAKKGITQTQKEVTLTRKGITQTQKGVSHIQKGVSQTRHGGRENINNNIKIKNRARAPVSLSDWRTMLGPVEWKSARDRLQNFWNEHDHGPSPWRRINSLIPPEIYTEYAALWGWILPKEDEKCRSDLH